MSRFIPTDVQINTLESPKFLAFLTNEINESLVYVKKLLYK
ncbi:MAG: hypothetical protein AB7F64_05695 [Gammaproteobacteria bacterium]